MCFATKLSFSQNTKVDSLLRIYKSHKEVDTSYLNTIYAIVYSYQNNDPDTSIYYANQLIKFAKQLNNKAQEGRATMMIGVAYNFKGDYKKAQEFISKAFNLLDKTKQNLYLGHCYYNQSNLLLNTFKYDAALASLKNAEKIFISLGRKEGIAACYANYAVLCHKTNKIDDALGYYLKSLKVREEIKDMKGVANCYINIGILYSDKSSFPKSLDSYFKALKIVEKLNDKRGIGDCLSSIGNLYTQMSNLDKAIEYHNKALKIREEIGHKKGLVGSYQNLGIINRKLKKFDTSIEYYLKVIKLSEEIGYLSDLGSCYMNIGNIFADRGMNDKAIEYYLKAVRTNREYFSSEALEITFGNMANLFNETGNYKMAIAYCDSALALSKEIGDIDGERLAYIDLSDAYSKLKNYKNAYEYHVKYTALTDSIFNNENSKQLGDLKTQFEVDKKEVELKAKAQAEQEKLKAIATEEKKRQTIVTYSIIVVLIIVIVFSALLLKRFRLTNKQKEIIEIKSKQTEEQKHIIEEKHKEITDSINYAERIQRSFLATKELLDENLKDYFVFFQPKDVVSGDFYYASKLSNGNFALITADSTGHGVPGAIMSLLNITSVETALKDGFTEPSVIFNDTRKTIIERLKKDGSPDGGKDGMDASLIILNPKKTKLKYAAANNPIWIIRNKEIIELAPDKMPIGKHDKDTVPFTEHEFDLQKGDLIYTLTDGMPDQFGGLKGKKFMYKQLKQLLISITHESMENQRQFLVVALNAWKGNLEQVDDITLIGIRI